MIKNKSIILSFLFTAWAIIFVHSVIPHHHHNPNDTEHHCAYHHNAEQHHIQQEEYHDCDHDCTDHACYFHVDVLTKINIDYIFIVNSDNSNSYKRIEAKAGKIYFEIALFSEQIPKTNYLRGPPLVA